MVPQRCYTDTCGARTHSRRPMMIGQSVSKHKIGNKTKWTNSGKTHIFYVRSWTTKYNRKKGNELKWNENEWKKIETKLKRMTTENEKEEATTHASLLFSILCTCRASNKGAIDVWMYALRTKVTRIYTEAPSDIDWSLFHRTKFVWSTAVQIMTDGRCYTAHLNYWGSSSSLWTHYITAMVLQILDSPKHMKVS